jgi:ribonuclease HI
LHGRAKELIAQLDWFSIGHAMREHNREADQLANEAMDKGMGRAARTPSPAAAQNRAQPLPPQEFEAVVKNGIIEVGKNIPDGTRVQIRIKPV